MKSTLTLSINVRLNRGVARNFLKFCHYGWPTKKILSRATAKAVNFGPFPMRFHVVYPVFFSRRTVLPTLTLD